MSQKIIHRREALGVVSSCWEFPSFLPIAQPFCLLESCTEPCPYKEIIAGVLEPEPRGFFLRKVSSKPCRLLAAPPSLSCISRKKQHCSPRLPQYSMPGVAGIRVPHAAASRFSACCPLHVQPPVRQETRSPVRKRGRTQQEGEESVTHRAPPPPVPQTKNQDADSLNGSEAICVVVTGLGTCQFS